MSFLYFKAFCSIVFLCCIQKITNVNTEIDIETVIFRIEDIIKALNIASYLYVSKLEESMKTTKLNRLKTIYKTKKILTEEVQKIIDNINEELKTGDTQNQPHCAESVTSEINELSTESDAAHIKCILESKPDIQHFIDEIREHNINRHRYYDFLESCLTSNNDLSTISECVDMATHKILDIIGVNENNINMKLTEMEQNIKNMEITVNNCQNKIINTIQEKANTILEHFNVCFVPT